MFNNTTITKKLTQNGGTTCSTIQPLLRSSVIASATNSGCWSADLLFFRKHCEGYWAKGNLWCDSSGVLFIPWVSENRWYYHFSCFGGQPDFSSYDQADVLCHWNQISMGQLHSFFSQSSTRAQILVLQHRLPRRLFYKATISDPYRCVFRRKFCSFRRFFSFSRRHRYQRHVGTRGYRPKFYVPRTESYLFLIAFLRCLIETQES